MATTTMATIAMDGAEGDCDAEKRTAAGMTLRACAKARMRGSTGASVAPARRPSAVRQDSTRYRSLSAIGPSEFRPGAMPEARGEVMACDAACTA